MSDRPGVATIVPRASANGVLATKTPAHEYGKFDRSVCQWRSPRRATLGCLAQRQAGWTRLQSFYLSIGDHEARELMLGVTD